MPARVPTATKKLIARLAEEGFSQVEIAREVKVDRRTVAQYVDGVTRPAPRVAPVVATVPQIPAELLDKLRFLAATVGSALCTNCQTMMYFLKGQTAVTCRTCKQSWEVTGARPDPRAATTPLGRPPQVQQRQSAPAIRRGL